MNTNLKNSKTPTVIKKVNELLSLFLQKMNFEDM